MFKIALILLFLASQSFFDENNIAHIKKFPADCYKELTIAIANCEKILLIDEMKKIASGESPLINSRSSKQTHYYKPIIKFSPQLLHTVNRNKNSNRQTSFGSKLDIFSSKNLPKYPNSEKI